MRLPRRAPANARTARPTAAATMAPAMRRKPREDRVARAARRSARLFFFLFFLLWPSGAADDREGSRSARPAGRGRPLRPPGPDRRMGEKRVCVCVVV